MSEKIYKLLLRLYPSHFRNAYGKEALQLFRDRSRNERGSLDQVRLWIDLLWDLALSLPHEHGRSRAVVSPLSAQHATGAGPSFCVLRDEPPDLRLMICAVATSVAVFGILTFAIAHGGHSGMRENPEMKGLNIYQPSQPHRFVVSVQPRAAGSELDSAERQRVLSSVINNLEQHYFDHAVARKTGDKLLIYERRGDYDSITDGAALANLLTRQIREESHDMHLEVVYSERPLPDVSAGPTPQDLERYRKAIERENCGFEKVTVLSHNIGYIKLDAFPDPAVCGPKAEAVMASLNNVDALIFDLRDNRGGDPKMVELIASYLFDHPEYWYSPREAPARQSWTSSPVPGNTLADKPAYVLTSSRTISGAEQFCYDLKMLKRATVVGETTNGSAHAGVWRRIDDHFGMGIPETKAINPYATADWEGIGVAPTVMVKAADALAAAEKLALASTSKR